MALAGTPVSNPALSPPGQRSFSRLALLALGFIVVLVLFGSVVRITNSGAGCGQHWPTCQGEITHLPRTLETFIEYGHRISAAVGGLVVLWLTLRAFLEPTRRAVRVGTIIVNLLMLLEFYIGRSLVQRGLVGQDASVARAVVMPLHLISTCLLTATLACIVWWSLPRAAVPERPSAGLARLTTAAGVLALLISMSGAVTALGDTVRPVLSGSFAARILEAEASDAHFLERVRGIHPVIAVLGALLLFSLARRAAAAMNSSATRQLGRSLGALTALQLVLGCLNVFLRAPGWLQVVHLLLANVLWIVLVMLGAEVREPRTAR